MCYSSQISWSSKKNLTPKVEDQKRLVQAYVRGMHGCGSQASAPASDAAGRGRDAADRASVPRRATWRFSNRADAAEIGADAAEIDADAAQIAPTRSVSAELVGQTEIQKKIKRCKTHRLT